MKQRVRHHLNSLSSLFVVPVLIIVLVVTVAAQAANTSLWLTSANPIINKGQVIDQTAYNEMLANRRGFNQGQQCINKKISIRSFNGLNTSYKNGCWYNTKIGLLYQDGTLLLQPGEETAGHIKGNVRDNSTLKPTPNPNVFLELWPDAAVGYGYTVRFRTIDTLQMKRTRHATGSVTLEYNQTEDAQLIRSGGSFLHVDDDYVWYSADAQWMLIWAKRGVLYRVNLKTFKILSVYVRDKPSGLLPGSAAISPSGRYIAIAMESASFADMFIADTETCNETDLAYASSGATCSVKSLKQSLGMAENNYAYPSLPRFYGEYMIGFVGGKTSTGDSTIYDTFTVRASGSDAYRNEYLALGDSFSSGEGAGEYMLGTDELKVNMCHTSYNSYPFLINARLNFTDFHSVACSGAKMDDINISPQWGDNLREKSIYLQPGHIKQVEAARNEQPNKVTLSISGNDIGFMDIVTTCIQKDWNCYEDYSSRKVLTNTIDGKINKLKATYKSVINNSAPDAQLYVLAYPQIVESGASMDCGVNVKLSQEEIQTARQLVSYFNDVIEYAARSSGAYFVDTEEAFADHKLCGGVSATIAVNGITLGDETGLFDDRLRFLSKGSFHPNILGQQLLMQTVLNITNNLTASAPQVPYVIVPPDANESEFLRSVPKDFNYVDRQEYLVQEDQEETTYQGSLFDLQVFDPYLPTLPNANYTVELHSTPIPLGAVTTDGAGNIATQITIPSSVEPGLHTLHIYGKGYDGNEIDIYKYIYVGVSSMDFDGDGILNNDEACSILDPANVDTDHDSIDDACDGNITKPDETPNPTAPGDSTPGEVIPENSETDEQEASTSNTSDDVDNGDGKPDNLNQESNPPLQDQNHQLSIVNTVFAKAQEVTLNLQKQSIKTVRQTITNIPPINVSTSTVLSAQDKITKIADDHTKSDSESLIRASGRKKDDTTIYIVAFIVLIVIGYSIKRYGKKKKD